MMLSAWKLEVEQGFGAVRGSLEMKLEIRMNEMMLWKVCVAASVLNKLKDCILCLNALA